jgi:tryptophanyl-tRNA synthetase
MQRILTGDRPTGRLHLGHYIGSLKQRILYQDDYQCFFIIADLHTLTTHPEKKYLSQLSKNIFDTVLDYLSVGIDPKISIIFVQSAIPEIFELNTLLGMLASVPRLQRIPSLKEMADSANVKVIPSGLLGYPVLMAADILLPRANLVPVGSDNLPNVAMARELARRFNHLYGPVFPIPVAKEEKTLIGLGGHSKMSKSLGNAIYLTDDPKIIEEKVMGMFTDPNRISANTPGKIEGNPVFIFHDAFNPDAELVEELKLRYRLGKVGDVEVKKKLSVAITDFLEPIRERREYFLENSEVVAEILISGNRKMKEEAQKTLRLIKDAMGLTNGFYLEVNHKEMKYQDSALPAYH